MVRTRNQTADNFPISLNQNWHQFSVPPVVDIANDKPSPPPPRRTAPPTRARRQQRSTPIELEHLDSSSALFERRGRANTIPIEGRLRGFLDFSTSKHRTRYDEICQRPLPVCKQIDSTTLNMLNIHDAVTTYFDAIGWNCFANISCDAYYELIYEFYTTFSFNTTALQTVETQNIICFRLLGKDFRMSISDFNIAMGFIDPDNIQSDSYHTALLDIPSDFNAQDAYRVLTHSNQLYNPKTTKDLLVHEPALRYIHRFLAFSFSVRNDSSSVLTINELFFLWCMHSGYKVNLGYWFARNFHAVLRCNRLLILGSYITNLTSTLFPSEIDFSSLTCAYHMDNLDKYCLDSMSLLVGTPTAYYFVPPGTWAARGNMVFHRRPHFTTREQEEQPPTLEARLSRIEARLGTMETQVSTSSTSCRIISPNINNVINIYGECS
ncbi:hypothetical protein PVK06_031641 [Gossypium arboreum]|uniref:Arabidopsis retrotransposon Orf1 C-terminal domain-containing protein n=1 Tax=Gossypium arboreum TaxID=29729 RepID=A0ABR0NSL2_GOSAR|nr:hypothetical protein PVK06_031641 [Gossypium arboreum]